MIYRVLTPIFTSAGISARTGKESFYVSWETLGYANGMEDARQLHPCPVLEPMDEAEGVH